MAGVVRPLEKRLKLKGAKIAVLGAGGAARAAVFGLVDQGAEVFIVNGTHEQAVKLAREVQGDRAQPRAVRQRPAIRLRRNEVLKLKKKKLKMMTLIRPNAKSGTGRRADLIPSLKPLSVCCQAAVNGITSTSTVEGVITAYLQMAQYDRCIQERSGNNERGHCFQNHSGLS